MMSQLSEHRRSAARQLFAAGFGIDEIAERLGLSPVTICGYVDPDFASELAAHNAKLRAADKERRAKAKAERLRAEALELQKWLAENTTSEASE
jgi:uncharacterized protein YjcR